MTKIIERLYPSTLYNSFSNKSQRDLNPTHITKESIFSEKIGNLYWSSPRTEIEESLAALAVALLPQSGIPLSYRLGWLSILLVWIVIRTLFAEAYKRRNIQYQDQLRWGFYYTVGDFITALIWSSLLIYATYHAPDVYMAVLRIVVISYLTNVVAGQYAFFPLASTILALVMSSAIIISFLIDPTPLNIAAAVFMLMYIYVIIGLGKNTEDRYNHLQSLRMELQEQKNAAEKANIAKTRFLAAASHDLRQPLHALSLFSELLEEETHNPNTGGTVKNIQSSIGSLESLLGSILDISKLDASVITPNITEFRLKQLLKIIETEFSTMAKEKGLEFVIEKPDLIVKSDFTLLGRILRNLVNNAVKYTVSGKINITCHLEGENIELSVADTGIGIDKEHQESVFEEFFQVGNPQREREQGLGLGLAIVRRLAELLGHRIELNSIPDGGTVFTISILQGSAQNITSTMIATDPTTFESFESNVWIIEDNAQVAEAQKSLLLKWGCRCSVFNDMNSVVKALEANVSQPEAILADYKLERDANGAEVIKLIRKHFSKNIPALIITGDTAPEQLKEIETYGIDVIHKPAKPVKLKKFLATIKI